MTSLKYILSVEDYIVICGFLVISASIGIASKFYGNQQKTINGYLLAEKNMAKIPVVLSVIVTLLSPQSLLSVPGEIYQYGIAFAINVFAIPIGMLLASWIFIPVYFQCGVSSINEMVPAYIVRRFSSIPGVTGLCISGIFSASLSTISSALNSASTVTVIDFIRPLYKNGRIPEKKVVVIAKALCLLYGCICIFLSFCFLDMGSMVKLMNVLVTVGNGPILAVFLVGVLTRKASDMCVSLAIILSYIIMGWISIGSLLSKYKEPPLPLSTIGCSSQNFSFAQNISSSTRLSENDCIACSKSLKEPFVLYRISFMWFTAIGFTLTVVFIFLAVLITGWKKNVIPSDSKCLSPVSYYFVKNYKPCERIEKDINDDKNAVELLLRN